MVDVRFEIVVLFCRMSENWKIIPVDLLRSARKSSFKRERNVSDNEVSLAAQFDRLQAERERTWTAEALKVNGDQRRHLVDTLGDVRRVSLGDSVELFELVDVDTGSITLDGLMKEGPVVLAFFRFAGCPACNIALPHYDRTLAPALATRGIRFVAVSPQRPDLLSEIRTRHRMSFSVASDPSNVLARRWGLTYEFNEASKRDAIANGRPIGKVTGTGTWELPMPTILLIDQNRLVRFVDINPDWLRRTESETVLNAVDRLGVSLWSERRSA